LSAIGLGTDKAKLRPQFVAMNPTRALRVSGADLLRAFVYRGGMNAIRTGQIAIVTGGASGIGRAVVHALAERGCLPVIFDIDAASAERVAGEVGSRGQRAKALTVDVRDRLAVGRAVQEVHAEHGRLDYMFNNAGVSVFGEVLDYDWAAWQDVIDTDLLGVVHGVAACYPLMVKQGSGHIVNTGSLASLVPTPWVTSYSAAKCGVWGLSIALRTEALAYGVRVSCVCPAAVETPMADRARYLNLDKTEAMKLVPGNRITPEACAAAILAGVERNDALITPSAAKWMSLAYRVTPEGAAKMMQGIAKKLSALRADFMKGRRSEA
jgi:NAD(P)-dependent dehydrogenase (short-subunit alcohol dehydrogenase family)